MLTFGMGIGGLLCLVGILTYWLAPIVGPNPFFGVRIGYAYANREAWDKTNRYGGAVMAIAGIVTAVLAIVLQLMNIPTQNGMTVLTIVMLLAMTIATVSMFAYARTVGQATPIAQELVPVEFNWGYLVPVLVTFIMLLALAMYVYPALPANRVPSHFNINDQVDGWQTRNEFLATFLGLGLFFVILNWVTVFVSTREPLVAFSRWGQGNGWRLDPERGLIFVGVMFASLNLLFMAILWNIAWLTAHGALAFSFAQLLPVILIVVVSAMVLFFLFAQKETV
jgi:uncharacterized membrane protein